MAATAYAALVSLLHVLNRIKHPYCPVPFNQSQIVYLLDKVNFLVDFLVDNDNTQRRSEKIEDLAPQIADAIHEVEDLIESHVLDRIEAKIIGELNSKIDFFLTIDKQRRTEEMERLIADASQLAEYRNVEQIDDMGYQLLQTSIEKVNKINEEIREPLTELPSSTVKPPVYSTVLVDFPMPQRGNNTTMVGFDDDLIHLMEMLTTNKSSCEIIPITGMGGIGKTTLALNIYNNPLIVNHFDIRAWVTISRDRNEKEIIIGLLRGFSVYDDNMSEMCVEELGVLLHKYFFNRKYLVLLDDVWSLQMWEKIMLFIPDNNNKSRILMTTRVLDVARKLGTCSPYELKFLDEEKSWELLSREAFGEEECPIELASYGKKISKSCKGLPLIIVVIGGLLNKTHDWENLAENVTSIMDVDKEEFCLKILSLSFNYLPINLKPCFLYLATFPKGYEINVSELIKLWVADGFLRPCLTKTLEEVALEYLTDLINRNLIMVRKRSSGGKIKYCAVHDILMDLCFREAQKEKFVCIANKNLPDNLQGLLSERRIVDRNALCEDLSTKPLARSFVSNSRASSWLAYKCKLLRVCNSYDGYSLAGVLGLYNLRLLLATTNDMVHLFPSTISFLWNLETLIIKEKSLNVRVATLPPEIWELPHLRHLVFNGKLFLEDPLGDRSDCVLNNLQTLSTIANFNITDDVVKRIPNVVKLGICYNMNYITGSTVSTFFKNLTHLQNLETLKCQFTCDDGIECVFNELETLAFGPNLKKLTLSGSHIPWENMTIVGSLPNLEVLKLLFDAFCGGEWNSIDGEFQRLKSLSIENCDLVTWELEDSPFPRLEYLHLRFLSLKEIPESIGEIDTLQLIELIHCQMTAIISAEEILGERQSQGSDDLVIQVIAYPLVSYREELMSLTNKSFQVQFVTCDDPSKPRKWFESQSLQVKLLFDHAGSCGGEEKVEEIISNISNDMVQHVLCQYMDPTANENENEDIKIDATIKHGNSAIDSLFRHVESLSSELIQNIKDRIKLKMEALVKDECTESIVWVHDKNPFQLAKEDEWRKLQLDRVESLIGHARNFGIEEVVEIEILDISNDMAALLVDLYTGLKYDATEAERGSEDNMTDAVNCVTSIIDSLFDEVKWTHQSKRLATRNCVTDEVVQNMKDQVKMEMERQIKSAIRGPDQNKAKENSS